MIYIQVGKNNLVELIHKAPFDPVYGLHTPKDELDKKGVFVDEVPEPSMIEGKRPIAKYNPDSKKVYYEYENIPLTPNERLNMIEGVINDMLLRGGDI